MCASPGCNEAAAEGGESLTLKAPDVNPPDCETFCCQKKCICLKGHGPVPPVEFESATDANLSQATLLTIDSLQS